MNQASLGYILEHPSLYVAKVISVTCKNWNCCNEDWIKYYETCRILHIKGRLRDSCLGVKETIPVLKPMVREWRDYLNA